VSTSPDDDRFNKLERRYKELFKKLENMKCKYNQIWGLIHELDETIMKVHMQSDKNSLDIARERATRQTIDNHENIHDENNKLHSE
jgi:predicted patatin/cPLA2 family phospholipase